MKRLQFLSKLKPDSPLEALLTLFLVAVPLYPKVSLFAIHSTYIPIRIDDVLIALVFIAWFSEKLITKKLEFRSPITAALVMFLLAVTVSTVFGLITHKIPFIPNAFHLVKIFEYLGLFFIFYDSVTSKAQLVRILLWTFAAALAVLVYGMLQYLGWVSGIYNYGFTSFNSVGRIISTIGDYHQLALYLVLITILFVSFLQNAAPKKYLWLLAILPLDFFILLQTQARIAIPTLLICLALLLLIKARRWVPLAAIAIFMLMNIIPQTLEAAALNPLHEGVVFGKPLPKSGWYEDSGYYVQDYLGLQRSSQYSSIPTGLLSLTGAVDSRPSLVKSDIQMASQINQGSHSALIFGFKNINDFYESAILGDGRIALYHWVNGENTPIAVTTSNADPTTSNNLSITLSDDTIISKVNDKEIFSAVNHQDMSGQIGLFSSGSITYFKNLQISSSGTTSYDFSRPLSGWKEVAFYGAHTFDRQQQSSASATPSQGLSSSPFGRILNSFHSPKGIVYSIPAATLNSIGLPVDASGSWRIFKEWPDNLQKFRNSPIIGNGLGVAGESADGYYVRILAEAGLIGLFALLFLFFKIISTSYTQLGRATSPFARTMLAFSLSSTIAVLLYSILIDAFVASRVVEIWWPLLAVAYAYYFHEERTSTLSRRIAQDSVAKRSTRKDSRTQS